MAEGIMLPFIADLEHDTVTNDDYRRVYWTSPDGKIQVVLMSLEPFEQIGMESHAANQFFRIERGVAEVRFINAAGSIGPGGMACVPGGTKHNIIAKSQGVKLYTIYAPMNHPRGLVEHTKPAND